MRPTTLWQAHANALLWGLGNGLVSTTLVTYLARELGAEGLAIGLIVAIPNLAGSLRLGTPWILALVGSRKWFSLAAFLLSGLLLLALPIACRPADESGAYGRLALLVILWGGWHLAMFLGVVALWSWLGDAAESKTRGTFIGIRTSLLTVGQIGGILAAAAFAYEYPQWNPAASRWDTLAWPALAGAALMIAAIAPLLWLRDIPYIHQGQHPGRQLLNSLSDPRFRPLLGFWCYAGLANGVTQAAQGLYPLVVLKLPVEKFLLLQAIMFTGQILVAPALGWLADRGRAKTIMIVSQILVSLALLFYPLASREQPLWLAGAYVLWIAWAGLNVCLPHLMLKLSPGENSPPYISMYFALGGLVTGLSSVICGALFDELPKSGPLLSPLPFDRFAWTFLLGTFLRLSSIAWLRRLPRDSSSSATVMV
jgi:MFS family permease